MSLATRRSIFILEFIDSGHHVSHYLSNILNILFAKDVDIKLLISANVYIRLRDIENIKPLLSHCDIKVVPSLDDAFTHLERSINQSLHPCDLFLPSADSLLIQPSLLFKYHSIFRKSNLYLFIIDISWINYPLKLFCSPFRFLQLFSIFVLFAVFRNINIASIDTYAVNTINTLSARFLFKASPVASYINDFIDTQSIAQTLNANHSIECHTSSSLRGVSRINVLVVGAITKRKNIDLLVDIVNEMRSRYSLQLHVTIAGKISINYSRQLSKILTKIFPHYSITNSFLSDEQLYSYINQSDLVWCLYQSKHVSSSGIALHSGFIGTPFISFDQGCLSSILNCCPNSIRVRPSSSLEQIAHQIYLKYSKSSLSTTLAIDTQFEQKFGLTAFETSLLSFLNQCQS